MSHQNIHDRWEMIYQISYEDMIIWTTLPEDKNQCKCFFYFNIHLNNVFTSTMKELCYYV